MKSIKKTRSTIKKAKATIIMLFVLVLGSSCNAPENNVKKETGADLKEERKEVLAVMKRYKDALQNLTTDGTFELFAEDSEVFESGGIEGTYKNYIEHHLGPELGHFKSFTFSDYSIDSKVDLPYAFTTETYVYTIVLAPDDEGESRTISKKGVATSILKKIDDKWKIIKTHSSSRNVKKSQ